MALIRNRMVIFVFVALASFSLLVGLAAALYGGATADSGTAGTFVLKAANAPVVSTFYLDNIKPKIDPNP
jgi:hypothetical protein